MKMLSIAITTIFIYGASVAQGNSHHPPSFLKNDPPARTEAANDQRVTLGDLKGPRAKNHPEYKYDASKVIIEAPHSAERQVGPEVKNNQPWESNAPDQHVVVAKKEKSNLKGPRAKNQKPWDN